MIQFEDITIEGFGSCVQEIHYRLDQPGLNIISGRNGSGKSTIVAAIFWALYGKTLKEKSEITPWEDLRPRDFNGTKVEINFETKKGKHKIIRCKNYKKQVDGIKGSNSLFWYPVRGKRSEIKDKRRTQADILAYIGLSDKLFTNSIIFGQNLTRLMGFNGSAQKDILDEALETSFITQAREKAQKDHNKVLEEISREEVRVGTEEARVENLEELIEGIKTQKKQFEREKASRIESLESRLESLQKSITLREEKQKKFKKLKDEQGKLKEREHKLTTEVAELSNKAEDYNDLQEDYEDGKDTIAHLELAKRNLEKQLTSKKTQKCKTC
jgi:exonuclease SbcC